MRKRKAIFGVLERCEVVWGAVAARRNSARSSASLWETRFGDRMNINGRERNRVRDTVSGEINILFLFSVCHY